MEQELEESEPPRHYPIENYRASQPPVVFVEADLIGHKVRHSNVMAQLQKEGVGYRKAYRRVLSVFFALSSVYMLLQYFPALHAYIPQSARDLLMIAYFFACVSSGVVMLSWRNNLSQIAASADKRDIGVFVDGLQVHNELARKVLVKLLPELRASDAALLDSEQRQILRKVLAAKRRPRNDVSLVLAILKALEQVDSLDDVPVVVKLASGEGFGKYRDVRLAATECLPALRRTASELIAQSTYLSASAASEAHRSELGIPVLAGAQIDGRVLLRATVGGIEMNE